MAMDILVYTTSDVVKWAEDGAPQGVVLKFMQCRILSVIKNCYL